MIPVREAYQKDILKYQSAQENGGSLELEAYLKKYHCPNLQFETPMMNIFSLTSRHAYIVAYVMRAKKSAGEVEEACQLWNDLAQETYNLKGQDRILKYLGIKRQDGIRDTTFSDTVENLNGSVDDALFFTNLAIIALQKSGKSVLRWPYKSKIIKLKINDEYQKLMPKDDHKPGWGEDLV